MAKEEKQKPKLKLRPLERKAIHVPTFEDYDELMHIYECGDWWWNGKQKRLPTQNFMWPVYEEETYILAKDKFVFGSRKSARKEGHTLITLPEFYDDQNPPITPEMIKEVNDWFKVGQYLKEQ